MKRQKAFRFIKYFPLEIHLKRDISHIIFLISILLIFFILTDNPVNAQTNEIDNRFRLAKSYEESGDLQKAKQIYEQLVKSVPDNFIFCDALNRIYLQLKEFDNSISLLQLRVTQNPQDINLQGMLGSSYYQKGDEKKAFEIWDKALEHSPQNTNNYRIIANYAIERRVFNKAIEYLTKGRKISDDNFYLSYELANMDALLMRYNDAAEEFCIILSKKPDQLNIIESKISTFINKSESVEPTITTVEKWSKENEDINFKILLAWLFMQTDQYGKAYEEYLTIEDKHKTAGSDLYLFAQQAYKEKHYDEASKAYKKIIDDYPNSAFLLNSRIGFAKTLEAVLDNKFKSNDESWKPFFIPNTKNADDYKEVISAYLQLTKLNQKNTDIEQEAYFRIGKIESSKLNNPDEADKYFMKAANLNLLSPLSIQSYKAMAEIEIDRNNLSAAGEYYNKILSAPRITTEDKNFAILMKAKIEFWQGNYSLSVKLLKDITRTPSDNSANDAINLSLIINTSKNDSLSLINFAKAELLIQQEKFNEAKEIYTSLSQNQNLLTLRDLSSYREAEMLIALDKLPEAIVQLKEISEQKEKNIYSDEALLLLGNVYLYGIKDIAKAQESYENLLANFPNSLYLDEARLNINLIKDKMNKSL